MNEDSNRYFYPQPPGGLAEPLTGLDPLIQKAVNILRAGGIETYESCQGGEGHAYTEPTIRFHGEYGEGFRAFSIARNNGMPVDQIRRSYSIIDGEVVGPYWEITFIKHRLEAWEKSR